MSEYIKAKICTMCAQVRVWDDFYDDASKSDGKKPQCRYCLNIRARQRQKEYQLSFKQGKLDYAEEKECAACHEVKGKNSFYKCHNTKNGLSSICKDCHLEMSRKISRKNAVKHRAEGINQEGNKVCSSCQEDLPKTEFYTIPSSSDGLSNYCKNCINKYHRENQYSTFHYAVATGEINKPHFCNVCGSNSHIVGHHEDYSKPLDVVWLCQRCHQRYHKGKISIE